MANEKKNMEAVQGAEETKIPAVATETTEEAQAPERVEGKDIITGFSFARREFKINEGEKDEKVCYDYFLKASFPYSDGQKEFLITFVPTDIKDIKTYEVLDLIYNMPGGVNFILRPWTIKADKKRGIEAGSGYSYVVQHAVFTDLEIKVKPDKESNKALLRAFLAANGYKLA